VRKSMKKYRKKNGVKALKYAVEYNRLNSVKLNKQKKGRRIAKRDEIMRYAAEYRRTHKEQTRDRLKLYRQSEIGRLVIRASNQRRQRRLPSLSSLNVRRVYKDNIKKYGELTCCLCLKRIKLGCDSIEHHIPVSRKSDFPGVDVNAYANLGVAHRTCNSQKGVTTINEWFSRKGGSCG